MKEYLPLPIILLSWTILFEFGKRIAELVGNQ